MPACAETFSDRLNQTARNRTFQEDCFMGSLSPTRSMQVVALTLLTLLLTGISVAQENHTSSAFQGVKVNGGTVTHSKQGGVNVLTLSDDFKVPDTPDPHWQVVDSKG